MATYPLATPCKNCGHPLNVHDNGGDSRVVRVCITCSCEQFEPIGSANPDRAQVGNGSARLAQVGGDHYRKFKIQPWDVIDEYDLSFYAGNALKYLLRAGNKGAKVEDLRKCRHYLDKLIEIEERKEQ